MNKKKVGIISIIGVIFIIGIVVWLTSSFENNTNIISDGSLDSITDYAKSWYYNGFDQKFLPQLTMPYGNGFPTVPYGLVVNPGNCKIQETLLAGVMSIPANEVLRMYGNKWTIAGWMAIKPAVLSQPFKFIYTDSDDLSMSYDPNNNYIELMITNSFQQNELSVVPLSGLDISKYNHFAWVQTPTVQQFYINGAIVLDKGMIASPIIQHYGNFFVESRGVIQFINLKMCNKPWNQATVSAELELGK
jgi:hypothetical protein